MQVYYTVCSMLCSMLYATCIYIVIMLYVCYILTLSAIYYTYILYTFSYILYTIVLFSIYHMLYTINNNLIISLRLLFKQQSVSIQELSADNCLRKFDVLKTNICLRSEASRANMLVLRTLNFQGATIRPIVPRHKHSIVFIVHH